MSMLTKRNELRLITQPQIEPSHDATNTVPMKLLLNQAKASASCVTNDTFDPTIKRKRRRNNCDVQIVPNKISKLKDQVASCSKKKSLEEHNNAEDEPDFEIIYEFLSSSISKQHGNSRGSDAKSIKSNTHLNRSKHTDGNMLNTNYSINYQKCSVTTCKVNSDELVNSRNSESSMLSHMNNNINDKQNSVGSCKNTFYVPEFTEENLSSNKNKENPFINTSNRRTKQSKNRIKDGNVSVSPKKHSKTTNNANGKITVKKYAIERNQSVRTGDVMVTLEEELHIIDTDQDAVCNSTNVCHMPIVLLHKLKQVQQQLNAMFSEEDLVNLSNTEDNILPYSKLFGGFHMNTSMKPEEQMTKEEAEAEHERFIMLDDEDSGNASSVSDNDEYKNLSCSQTLNEDKIKIQMDDVPMEEQPAHALDKFADKLPSNMNEGLEMEKEGERSTCREGEDNDDDNDRTTNEMHWLRTTSMGRMEVDSVDSATSSIESFSDSTISNKKFLKNKTSSSFGFRSQENDSRPTSSTTKPIVSPRKELPGRKAIVIEPLPRLPTEVCLSTRKRNSSANSARQSPEKSPKQSSKEKKEFIEKDKIEEHMPAKDQRKHRALNKSADCVSPTNTKTSLFTKEEKKQLVDDRKQKLKKIALEKIALEKNQEKKQEKKRTKPKVKQSLKMPSDLLLEDMLSASKLRDIKEIPKFVNRPAAANNVLVSPRTADSVKAREAAKKMPTQLQNSSFLSGLGEIPKKSNPAKAKTKVFIQDALEEVVQSQEIGDINSTSKGAEVAKHKSTRPVIVASTILKSSIETSSRTEMTNEFLWRIVLCDVSCLDAQQRLNLTAPVRDELDEMLTHYTSYNEYCKAVLVRLVLMTIHGITKEFQDVDKKCRQPPLTCSIVSNFTETNTSSSNLHFTTLMLEVLVTRDDLQKQAYPNYGDLVCFEYSTMQQNCETFYKVFAYVDEVRRTRLPNCTHSNKDLTNYVERQTYIVLTKPLEPGILVNRIRKLRRVTYLHSNLWIVQALEYLPKSPLMNLILSPTIEQYHLPTVPIHPEKLFTREKLNKKQLEAVFKVTEAIIQNQEKLCFIQGPPGTGKSKVIANIVSQVLYEKNWYTSRNGALKILVCAPSDAAVDEITLRLYQIRSSMKKNRFKLVTFRQSKMMHPDVKPISVTELAKQYVEREKSILESKIYELNFEIASTHNMDESRKKDSQTQMADLQTQMAALNIKSSENMLLSKADIITCTLLSKQMETLFVTNKMEFSVCIMDEATQSTEAETLIPLMLGVKTLVLVGDPNQLPASVQTFGGMIMGPDQSIFSRVQNAFKMNPANPIITLDTQYRMSRDIFWWPNKFFYAGKIETGIPRNEAFPFHSYRIFNLRTNQNNDNLSNTTEAQFVAIIMYTMLTSANLDGWKCISYGILTPYTNQKHVLQIKINELLSLLPENLRKKIKFDVSLIDDFRGQERDVVIMSCVRTQNIGMLSDWKRLCVALTRAKHSLLICGNFSVFNKDPMWNSLLSDAKSREVYFNINAQVKSQEIKRHVVK